jgi:hypothetical protein
MTRTLLVMAGFAAWFGLAMPVAQEESDWADWPWVRTIELPPATDTRLVSVTLPPDLYARVPATLGDLRVVDDQDREVPFVVHVPRGTHRLIWQDARILETSVLPGAYTQIVVDTAAAGSGHNAIELTVRETDFFTWVQVAASDDGTAWRLLDERLPFYRFAGAGHADAQVLRHRRSVSPWLRLRLLHGSDAAVTVTGVRLADEVDDPPELLDVPVTFSAAADLAERHSGWQTDLGAALPVSEAVFTAGEGEFHRPVLVRVSDDGRRWRLAGQGEIFRLRRGDTVQERLRVPFPETASRHVRVEMFNRNDPPLAGLSVSLRSVARQVVLRQEPGRAYQLLYGRDRTPAPSYELARLVTADELRTATRGALGEERSMPGHPRPLPWTERHTIVLWIALALAVGVLGWLALRSLREPAA